MNRVFLKSLFVAMLAVSSIAHAQDDKAPKADPSKGETLYVNGDSGRNITACIACHGAAGNSTIVQNPKIAGQHAQYVYKQLVDFASGDRTNPVMSPIAKALTEADMKNIAAYLNQQVMKPGAAKNKETVDLGRDIYRGGIAEKNVPACAACHGPTAAGIPAQYPRLGGQHQDYTSAQLTAFRDGTRSNSPQMKAIAERLSDKEIRAVSDYIAGLK